MSKRFLKNIGFIALLIFVSHVTSQPTSAMQRATWGDVEDDPDLKSFISLRVKDGEQLLRVIKMTGYIGRERFLPALPIKNEGIYAGTEEIRVCYRNEALNSDTKWIFLTDIEYSRN